MSAAQRLWFLGVVAPRGCGSEGVSLGLSFWDEEVGEVGREAGRLRVVPRWLSSVGSSRTAYEGEGSVDRELQE